MKNSQSNIKLARVKENYENKSLNEWIYNLQLSRLNLQLQEIN